MLFIESLFQTRHSNSYCTRGQAEYVGHILPVQTFEIKQQHRPVDWIQTCQENLQDRQRIADVGAPHRLVNQRRGRQASLANELQRGIYSNAKHPGRKAGSSLEARQSPPQGDTDLLQQILAVVVTSVLAGDPP